jgi:two-component system LytT family sensor kinase
MRNKWRPWLLGWAAWTALALLSATDLAVFLTLRGEPVDYGSMIPRVLINWYSCAVFTPFFFYAARRWPIDARHWLRHGPIHLLICAIASVLKFIIEGHARQLLMGLESRPLLQVLQSQFVAENIAFWCMAGVIHAIEFQRRAAEREVLTSRLHAKLSEANLTALTARLHPHFLFNTLQGISTLLHRDPLAADAMLTRLSALLRRVIEPPARHEVTLATEMDLLEDYLAIAQARFGERVTIHRQIEPDATEGLLPYMALQPLVENAFEHGIARRAGQGQVTITAQRIDNVLQVDVLDDGHAMTALPRPDGVGLGTTRARLAALYGDSASLEVGPAPGGGNRSRLIVPWHVTFAAPDPEALA